MRILHTAATYSPSLDGVAEVVRNISERLAKRGHDVHVATATVGSESPYAELCGVHVHRFKANGNLALGMRGEVEQYRQFVRSGEWDLLVNHCLQTWTTDALLGQIRSYAWGSVLVTHGLSIHNPVFHAYYLEIPRYVSTYCKWVRVSNVSGESSLAEKCNLPVPPVITNGVDLNEWARPTLGLRQAWGVDQKPWVVNVSNHNPLKDHRTFFRLASRLRAIGAHFTLIGSTYPMSKWGLGRFGVSGGCAYECRIGPLLSMGAVDLKTNLPRREVVSAIQEADVVVSTSKWETNSLVLLESMAAGTPWVSFDVGSARENIGGAVAGNLDDMANSITELVRDHDRRKSLGRAGRARIAVKHDWESITDRYEQLYESLVEHQV
jgi:glycosyltransferase involved in cell wall biosynthesis